MITPPCTTGEKPLLEHPIAKGLTAKANKIGRSIGKELI
jgi:hypothetical protein